jgi:hypothetical protein
MIMSEVVDTAMRLLASLAETHPETVSKLLRTLVDADAASREEFFSELKGGARSESSASSESLGAAAAIDSAPPTPERHWSDDEAAGPRRASPREQHQWDENGRRLGAPPRSAFAHCRPPELRRGTGWGY